MITKEQQRQCKNSAVLRKILILLNLAAQISYVTCDLEDRLIIWEYHCVLLSTLNKTGNFPLQVFFCFSLHYVSGKTTHAYKTFLVSTRCFYMTIILRVYISLIATLKCSSAKAALNCGTSWRFRRWMAHDLNLKWWNFKIMLRKWAFLKVDCYIGKFYRSLELILSWSW